VSRGQRGPGHRISREPDLRGRFAAGPGAPGDRVLAPVTQAWLAVSPDPDARATGGYFYHQKPRTPHPAARDLDIQDRLLRYRAALTGVTL
jgi:hypothetical protein